MALQNVLVLSASFVAFEEFCTMLEEILLVVTDDGWING